jgi:hypothetical protein
VLWIFYRPKKSIALAGFEPATFGSSGKHTNHYTTMGTLVPFFLERSTLMTMDVVQKSTNGAHKMDMGIQLSMFTWKQAHIQTVVNIILDQIPNCTWHSGPQDVCQTLVGFHFRGKILTTWAKISTVLNSHLLPLSFCPCVPHHPFRALTCMCGTVLMTTNWTIHSWGVFKKAFPTEWAAFLSEDIPLQARLNTWLQHGGPTPHFSL